VLNYRAVDIAGSGRAAQCTIQHLLFITSRIGMHVASTSFADRVIRLL
jgi:hypothetical protein